jgi:hypothetical protein
MAVIEECHFFLVCKYRRKLVIRESRQRIKNIYIMQQYINVVNQLPAYFYSFTQTNEDFVSFLNSKILLRYNIAPMHIMSVHK